MTATGWRLRVVELRGNRLIVEKFELLKERWLWKLHSILLVIAALFITRSIKVVPQQNAWVVERLGSTTAAWRQAEFLVPFIDKVAYKHTA